VSTERLAAALDAATGADPDLDALIAATFARPQAPVSASVEACIELLHELLPGAHWHVGWDASGILPYARIERGRQLHAERAATVPIALLRAMIAAHRAVGAG
jgi:hypothetical protein